MNIQSTRQHSITPKSMGPVSSLAASKADNTAATLPEDSFVGSQSQVFGSIGAMGGALSGRAVASVAVAGLAGAVANSAGLGTLGTVVAAGVGLYGGIKLELQTKAGRLVGGMIGGALGSAAGSVLDTLGVQANPVLAQECKGFSVSSLPKKLLNPHYTSHPKMSGDIVKEGMAKAQPGDLIITNDDGNFMLELLQKAGGATADWTHNYMVDKDGTVMDILITDNKPTRWPLSLAFEDNTHAKILRPKYASEESKEKTLQYARDQFDKIGYDKKFDLKTDDAQYCQEYAYKALKAGAPEIRVETTKAFFVKEIVSADEFAASPDIEEVWSSGSNFWLNWLSHFN